MGDNKPTRRTNRFKIKCLECNKILNHDHRNKHNKRWHSELLKKHKFIKWERLDARKNPFETSSSRRTADELNSYSEHPSDGDAYAGRYGGGLMFTIIVLCQLHNVSGNLNWK